MSSVTNLSFKNMYTLKYQTILWHNCFKLSRFVAYFSTQVYSGRQWCFTSQSIYLVYVYDLCSETREEIGMPKYHNLFSVEYKLWWCWMLGLFGDPLVGSVLVCGRLRFESRPDLTMMTWEKVVTVLLPRTRYLEMNNTGSFGRDI